MVKINSTSRFLSIEKEVILTQTDTTVGFLSQNERKLKEIKSRENSKPFIRVYKSFHSLKEHHIRIPKNRRKEVRRAKKTTFIVKNVSFRVAKERVASAILRATSWNYSTSANASGKNFDLEFCEQKADIIIQNNLGLFEGEASSLYKINHKKRKKLR